MNNLIQKAIAKAIIIHEGQVRKGDGKTPYVLHSLEVGIVLSSYTTSEVLISAGILHDVLEDGKISKEEMTEEFGNEILSYVELLTENKSISNWAERKAENLNRLAGNKAIYVIKVVDTYVNMKDLLAAIREQGEGVWEKFNANKEMKMSYFERILADTKTDMPSDLLEKYVSVLKDLQYSEYTAKKIEEIGFKE